MQAAEGTQALQAIGRWMGRQRVVSYCVVHDAQPWCANAFYLYDPQTVALYLLSETTTRHGQMIGQQALVAGTISGQNKTVALIRGVQFAGEIRLLEGEEAQTRYLQYCQRFPVARLHRAPVWELELRELKFTDNTLGFGTKLYWQRG